MEIFSHWPGGGVFVEGREMCEIFPKVFQFLNNSVVSNFCCFAGLDCSCCLQTLYSLSRARL